jgi:hypothetical protein
MPWGVALVACLLAVLALSQTARSEARALQAAQALAWMETERIRAQAAPTAAATAAATAASVRDALTQTFGPTIDIGQRGKRLIVQLNAAPTDRTLTAIQELERVKNIPVRAMLLKADGIARVSGAIEVDVP